jgi:hypothetical protein
MKALFITLLIFGGAFLAYDYYGAPPGQKLVFKSLNSMPAIRPVPASEVREAPAAPEARPAAAPPVATAPMKAKDSEPVAKPLPVPAKVSSGPHFESIETLTGNWQQIPASAFSPPREVKLLQDAEFKMSVGTSKVAAGGVAFAIAASNGVLTLAPTATSPARAQLPLDATDLKARLTAVYETWKLARAEELKAIAARKQQMAAAPVVAPSSSEVDAGGKPIRSGDGTYPLLIASMKRGQVTEITPENITGWQEAQPAPIQGKNGWAVKVNYHARTIFGDFPVEAQALILDGCVTGWYYTGSGEEVP